MQPCVVLALFAHLYVNTAVLAHVCMHTYTQTHTHTRTGADTCVVFYIVQFYVR